jgi:hypothetical protein
MRPKRELDPTNYLFQRRKFYLPNRFSPLLEIAIVLVRFDHVASFIVNAKNGIVWAAAKLRVVDCVADRIRFAVPQPTERQRIGNQIKAAFIFAPTNS